MERTYSEFMQAIHEEARKNNIPSIGNIELTSRCNLRCKMCYVVNEDGGQDLSTDQWNSLLGQAVEAGLREAYLSGGEPLIRDDFEEIYCKLYDKGVRVMIITNGLLVNSKLIDMLKRRPPEGVSITLYGSNNDSYNTITGCSDGYDRVQRSVELLIKNHMPLSLKVQALRPLKDDYYAIMAFARSHNLGITFGKYISPFRGCYDMQVDWRMDAKEIAEFTCMVEGSNKTVYAPSNRSGRLDCNCGKGRFAICYDGRLVGCLSYTELHTEPLVEGFEAALFRLRELITMQNTHCEDCMHCECSDTCSMCPGINYAETGSLEICSKYRKSLAMAGVL